MSFGADAETAAERAKVATGLKIDRTTSDLAAAWSRAWDEIASEWDAAIEDLVAATHDGQWPTRAQINRSRRAQAALQAASDALTGLSGETQVRIVGDLPGLLSLAEQQQRALIGVQLPRDAAVDWARLDGQALKAIVKRTTRQITALTWPLAAEATDAMRSALIRGVAVGDNPRTAARDMVARVKGAFDGGYTRAENIARTEMIDAHREAARQAQDANRDVLQGWRWTAALSDRTCPACLSKHGQVFDLDEPGPLGHQSCRCARTPVTRSWQDLGFDLPEPTGSAPTGPEWLAKQPEAVQRKILGPKRYEAWKAGQYPPEQWAVRRSTTGWRDSFTTSRAPEFMATAAPVRSLTDWAAVATPEAIESKLAELMTGIGSVSGITGRRGLDIEKLRGMATAVERLVSEYPQVKFNLVIDSIKRGNVMAQAECRLNRVTRGYTDMTLRVNTAKLSSRSKMGAIANGSERDTFWWTLRPEVPDVQTFDYVLNHEFGHLIDYTTGNYKSRTGISPARNMAAVAREQGIDQPPRYFIVHTASPEEVANYERWQAFTGREMSRYARTSTAEGIAEAFADVRINGSYASETNRRTVEQLLGKLRVMS